MNTQPRAQAVGDGADPRTLVTHPQVRPGWLGQVREDILEPDMAIIDPHHHLWDHSGGYFAADLLADAGSGHRIVGTVFVQCHYAYRADGPDALRPVGETEFVVASAEEAERLRPGSGLCAGIVGFADLQLGAAVDAVLEAHMAAGRGRFRGIRRLNARSDAFRTHLPELPPHLLADPAFRDGFSRLAPHGLSFDAWCYHPQIAEVTDLARAFPQTRIVLDHLGSPLGIGPYRGQHDSVFAAWRADIGELAACPNVAVKLGGLAMAVSGFDFHTQPLPPTSQALAEAWRPYIETAIALFGVERCMFESNFPVDKGMVSYPVLWNTFKRLAAGASPSEKAALFAGTADRIYRLGLPR